MRQSWTVGEKVYIADIGTVGADEYTPAVIVKLTPSGLIHAKYNITEMVVVFNKDGYESGRYGRSKYLDTYLTFEERGEWLGEQERIKYATEAIVEIEPAYLRQWWLFDKLQLLTEVNRLQTLLDTARDMVESI